MWWRERTAYLPLVESGFGQPLLAEEFLPTDLTWSLRFGWFVLFTAFTVYWLVELMRCAALIRAMGVTLLTMGYTTAVLGLLGWSTRFSRLSGGGISPSEAR